MKLRKIGIIDHVGNKSGMDFYDNSLSKELAKKFQVSVFSNFENSSSEKNNFDTIKTFYNSGESIFSKILYFFLGFYRSFRLVKKKSIETVLFHSFSFEYKDLIVYIIAKLLKINILLIVHDVSGFAKKDKKIVKSIILKRLSKYILVHNEFSKKEILKNIIDVEKIIIISLGDYIDQVKLLPRKVSIQELQLNENFKYILFFGQIKEVKGLDILINSFSRLKQKDLKLIIAGKVWNDDGKKYLDLIKSLKMESSIIFYERFITDHERDLFFSLADVVVLPYRKIYQSAVLMTALSYPSLVICSDLETNKEIISNFKNGFLFESENIESLTTRLYHAIELGEKAQEELKKEALLTVKEKHSWKHSAEAIFKKLYPNG
jgi:glycosyltransferase involved in cell wall biosynthesis